MQKYNWTIHLISVGPFNTKIMVLLNNLCLILIKLCMTIYSFHLYFNGPREFLSTSWVRQAQFLIRPLQTNPFLIDAGNRWPIDQKTDSTFWIQPQHGIIKWKDFPHYWSSVKRIHRSPVDSPHKGQWHRALMFSLCAWTNSRANSWDAGDLTRHSAHYCFTIMQSGHLSSFKMSRKKENVISWLHDMEILSTLPALCEGNH